MFEIFSDWPGWVALLLTYVLVFTQRRFTDDPRLFVVVVVGLTLHHGVALYNAYIGYSFGADEDAGRFQRVATQFYHSQDWEFSGNVGSEFYSEFLATLYRVVDTPSHLFGMELSILAFLAATLVLVRLAEQLKVSGKLYYALGLVWFLPSFVLLTSITLREAYQICFVLLAMLGALELKAAFSLRSLLTLFSALFFLALSHNGLVVYCAIFLTASIFWIFFPKPGDPQFFKRSFTLLAGFSLVGVFFALYSNLGTGRVFNALISQDLTGYSESYRSHSNLEAGASYGVLLDTSSPVAFVVSLAQIIALYFVAPLPWQMRSPLDIYAFFENGLRLYLISIAVRMIYAERDDRRAVRIFLLGSFFLLEILWAMGTVNWGTAMRHHMVAFPLLLLAAMSFRRAEEEPSDEETPAELALAAGRRP